MLVKCRPRRLFLNVTANLIYLKSDKSKWLITQGWRVLVRRCGKVEETFLFVTCMATVICGACARVCVHVCMLKSLLLEQCTSAEYMMMVHGGGILSRPKFRGIRGHFHDINIACIYVYTNARATCICKKRVCIVLG